MSFKSFISGLFITAFVTQPVHANDWYISAGAGISFTEDADYTDSTAGAPSSGSFDLKETAVYSFALGHHLNDNFRLELEGAFRNPDVESISTNGAGNSPASGELESTGLLVNAYYDIMPESLVNPYLTVGIGGMHHDATLRTATGSFQGDDTVFAYQLGAGLDIAVNESIILFTDYRYVASEDAQIGSTEIEYSAHEIRAGMRYGF